MSKASNESIEKFVQITRHTAVAGVVALSAIATLPVVASAALPGERIGVDAPTMEANAASGARGRRCCASSNAIAIRPSASGANRALQFKRQTESRNPAT